MTETNPRPPVLHLVCGKPAAGKSTLTARLGAAPGTVVIAEDDWLTALFGDRMATLGDYVAATGRLRAVMGPHVVALLNAGLDVVLDFPANTVATRAWMRGLFEAAGAGHVLHVLDVPDAVCRSRLAVRNAGGAHPFALSPEEYDVVVGHIVMPEEAEGFVIERHGVDGG